MPDENNRNQPVNQQTNQDNNPPEGDGGTVEKPDELRFTQEQFDKAVDEHLSKKLEDLGLTEEMLSGEGYDPYAQYSPSYQDASNQQSVQGSQGQNQNQDVTALRKEIADVQTRMEEQRILNELDAAEKDFPLLDRRDILFSILSKPTASIRKLAKESHKAEEAKKQKYIDEYKGTQTPQEPTPKKSKEPKGAPPLPSGSSSPGPTGTPEPKEMTFEEAEKIARQLEVEAAQE